MDGRKIWQRAAPACMACLILILLILSAGCTGNGSASGSSPANAASSDRIQVVTSSRPITLLVAPVAGDAATVTQLLPPGAEPHEYEPTPSDAMALRSGDIFFYDGPAMEPWAASLAASANASMKVVSFGDAVTPPVLYGLRTAEPGLPDPSSDPHIWLSPELARLYVNAVGEDLAARDPANAAAYRANAAAFAKRLEALGARYSANLSACRVHTVLSSHAFLGYPAAAYRFTGLSITGLNAGSEPSAGQMASVLDRARGAGVKGVIAEAGESDPLSASAAAELGVPVLQFETMEFLGSGAPEGTDSDYVAIMDRNLLVLQEAMGCP